MATNARGSSTQPSGIPSRPYFGGSAARRAAGNPTARTSPPSAPTPARKVRRLTFTSKSGRSDGASLGTEIIESRGALISSLLSGPHAGWRSEEHTSELQSRLHLVCRLLLEKKKIKRGLYTLTELDDHVRLI